MPISRGSCSSFRRAVRANKEYLVRTRQKDQFLHFPTRAIEEIFDETRDEAAWVLFQHMETTTYWPDSLIWHTAVWEYTVWWQQGVASPVCLHTCSREIQRPNERPLHKHWCQRHVQGLTFSDGVLQFAVEGDGLHTFTQGAPIVLAESQPNPV